MVWPWLLYKIYVLRHCSDINFINGCINFIVFCDDSHLIYAISYILLTKPNGTNERTGLVSTTLHFHHRCYTCLPDILGHLMSWPVDPLGSPRDHLEVTYKGHLLVYNGTLYIQSCFSILKTINLISQVSHAVCWPLRGSNSGFCCCWFILVRVGFSCALAGDGARFADL